MQRTVDLPITHVTVYPDSALIRRRNVITLTGEERSLTLTQLPEQLQPNSIQVSGQGQANVLLLAVETQATPTTEATPDSPLIQAIQASEQERQQFQNRREALHLQRRFIQQLGEQAVEPFAQSLAQQQMNFPKTQQFLTFVESQYLEISEAIAALEQQVQQLDKEITRLRRDLQGVYSQNPRPHGQLLAHIKPFSQGDWLMEVTYRVSGATWEPAYDLRWESGQSKLHLSHLARIQQATGEDWSEVELTLCTNPPNQGPLPPTLESWYVDLPPNPFVNMRYGRERYQAAFEEIESLEGEPIAIPEAELEDFPTTVLPRESLTYVVPGYNTIPSDRTDLPRHERQPHTVTLRNEELPVTWRYIAIPRLSLQSDVEITTQNPALGVCLLSGVGQLFRDGAYIGQVTLPTVAPGAAFPLRFGPDSSIQLDRRLSDRKLETNLRGNRHRLTYSYELRVRNLATQTNELRIIEQIPVSRNEKLKVQITRIRPKVEADELGQLVWNLHLEARSEQLMSYQFTVEYPGDLEVKGLDI